MNQNIISSIHVGPLFILSKDAAIVQQGSIIWFGIEIETLISISIGILSVFLFVISFIAYKKDGRKRLLFVTVAFFLFAVKGFLPALDNIFSVKLEPFELISQLLDFIIITIFFFGLVKE